MFELTGALSHVLPIMISVVVSKWVADALGKDGIYAVWIAMRQYPWLPQTDYRDRGQTAAQIMKPAHDLIVIHDDQTRTIGELLTFVKQYQFHGFPVVDDEMLVGFVVREKLRAHLGESGCPGAFPLGVSTIVTSFLLCQGAVQLSLASRHTASSPDADVEYASKRPILIVPSAEHLVTDEIDAALLEQHRWTFNRTTSSANLELVNLSPLLDEAVLQLRKDVPLQLVVSMFQKMVTSCPLHNSARLVYMRAPLEPATRPFLRSR